MNHLVRALTITGLATTGTVSSQVGEAPAASELRFKSHDGHAMFGKLTLPKSAGRHMVVIYVQCAEGMTVDMKRPLGGGKTFDYFDIYRTKLPEMNVGFFSYEGRGITMGDELPRYEKIDRPVYNTSTLDNKVRDLLTAIDQVRKQPGVDPNRIYLMGASEGTLLAADAATREPKKVAGLILYGVLTVNLKENFKYIMSDGAFLMDRRMFDADKDGKITKAEFEADPKKYREQVYKGAPFVLFDRDKDGVYTVADTCVATKPYLDAIEKNDFAVLDAWSVRGAAVALPAKWFQDHFAHKPMWDFVSKLDIPIGCFQGDLDQMVSTDHVRAMEKRAKAAGKSKMEFHYFTGLDHSLHIGLYFARGTIPDGHKAIFEFIRRQASRPTLPVQ